MQFFEDHKASFHEDITKYLHRITMDHLHPDMSGIRPKLQGPGESYCDFIICEESDRGFPGLISLIRVESPGITSCLAIQNKIQNILG